MEDKNNLSIFRGSAVEADTVHDYLAQNNIGSLVRNHMHENLDAGWVTAAPDHAAEVFVAREDEAKAQELLKNLFHEEGSTKPGATQKPANAVIVQPTTTQTNNQAPTTPKTPPQS